jgi:hypothetical protein
MVCTRVNAEPIRAFPQRTSGIQRPDPIQEAFGFVNRIGAV